MSRSGLRGARRTRVYDCNYNAGEKYYKPALDNIDRKYYGKPLLPERTLSSPRPSPFARDVFSDEPFDTKRRTAAAHKDFFNDDHLENARRRAERVIQEDAFYDVRGARVPKSTIGSTIDDFDNEVHSSLSRLRANKKATNFSSDADFEDAVDSIKRRSRFDFTDKLDADVDNNRAATSIKKSTFKLSSRREEDTEPLAITKWTAVSNTVAEDNNSGAALRARATKARLDDLESEMFERSEKQLAREKRSQQLKQFLADSDIEVTKASF